MTTVYCDLDECINSLNGVCQKKVIMINYDDFIDIPCENFETELDN